MALGRKKQVEQGHDVVIAAASKMYDDSVSLFVQAEKKIDEANLKLDATIEEIDAKVAELLAFKDTAVADKERNVNFKEKLKAFTTN